MEDMLVIVFWNQKSFGGKLTGGGLRECIEFITLMSPQGQAGIVGLYLGRVEKLPSDVLIVELDRKSLYYQNYVQITSGLSLIRPA